MIFADLGLGSYRSWSEAKRQEWLISELQSKRPLYGADLVMSEEMKDVMDTIKVVAELPPDSFSAYVISMATTSKTQHSIIDLYSKLSPRPGCKFPSPSDWRVWNAKLAWTGPQPSGPHIVAVIRHAHYIRNTGIRRHFAVVARSQRSIQHFRYTRRQTEKWRGHAIGTIGMQTSSTRKLGSGEMTVRPLKSTRLPDRLPRKRPCLPFNRWAKPLKWNVEVHRDIKGVSLLTNYTLILLLFFVLS